MKHSPRMNISESEYHLRRRCVIALSVFAVLLAVANMLWGCYQSSRGIQPSDYVAAALLAVLVATCCYAGWRIAVQRMAGGDTHGRDQENVASSAEANDSEA